MSFTFWCSLASTYTYLATARIDALAAAAGVEVAWQPFTLHPIFNALGWATSPFEIYADKGRYMWRDMEREAERLGIPFRRPSQFPREATPAAKIAIVGLERGWGARFIQRVMAASYADDRDIGRPEVIDEILHDLDRALDPRELRAAAATPALRRATERAMALHIFGAPTFMVGDEMFWGNDRLEQALAWASTDHN